MKIERAILPALGLIFISVGLALLLFFMPSLNQAAERVESLPSLTAATLAQGPPGREGLLEGRISERNPTYFRDFVAYVRYEYQGRDNDNDNEVRWVEDERVTPPLLLDLPGGRVQLENSNYDLQGDLIQWQTEPTLTWDNFSREGTKSYYGVERGNAVVALGTVVEGAAGRLFRAEWLYRGARTAYIEGQRGSARVVGWLGGVFSFIGAGILGLGVWLWLRLGK
ncbi:MAG TPA: hypothetical protein VEC96_11780 [Anaerolineae bacterium]|nr:hypothetical protein [Anaerolineae bacterium]